MRRIPSATLRLGIDMDELIATTEECTQERRSPPCLPEEFSAELKGEMDEHVSSFYLDVHEVSLREYTRCITARRCRRPNYEKLSAEFRRPELPVVMVSHRDAEDYCHYIGARLPTEAEFEAAARGPKYRRYPWGGLHHRARANGGQSHSGQTDDRDGYELLAPVRSMPDGKTPQGVLHLAGNVSEWSASDYSAHGEKAQSSYSVVKGGHFAQPPIYQRGTSRVAVKKSARRATIGFRCARSLASSH